MAEEVREDVNEDAEDQDNEDVDEDLDADTSGGEADDDQSGDEKPAGLLKEDGTPFTDKDLRAIQKSKKKAEREAKRFREELDALRKAQAEGKPADEDELEKIRREASETGRTEAETTWKPRTVKMAAKAALADAGFKGKSYDKAFKWLEFDDIDFDDDGEAYGLDEQIEELKVDMPEWFKSEEDDKPRRRPTTNVDSGNKKNPPEKEKKTADILLERLKAGA